MWVLGDRRILLYEPAELPRRENRRNKKCSRRCLRRAGSNHRQRPRASGAVTTQRPAPTRTPDDPSAQKTSMTSLQISHEARYVEIEGRVVVLDFRTQSYSMLDPVASTIWLHIASGRRRDDALQALRRQYEVDGARLEHDYDALVQKCLDQGLLTLAPLAPRYDEPQTPPAKTNRHLCWGPWPQRAWWSLFRTSRLLAKRGFSHTYRQLAQRSIARETADDLQRRLDRGVKAFATAENFFYLKRAPNDCLPRSLALFGFLCSLGLPVVHHIGVQTFPFLAHAWVQHDDQVLHDDPSNPKRFATIASIPDETIYRPR